jgi:hypothetical protein
LIGGSATAESPSFIRAFVERIQKASPHWGTQVEKDCMMSIGQTLSIPHQDETASNEEIVMRKVWRRILLFGFLLLLFAQIDKHNIAFAGLTMSNDLGLTATTFGFCVSIFYVGYILCEIPSNLIMVGTDIHYVGLGVRHHDACRRLQKPSDDPLSSRHGGGRDDSRPATLFHLLVSVIIPGARQ